MWGELFDRFSKQILETITIGGMLLCYYIIVARRDGSDVVKIHQFAINGSSTQGKFLFPSVRDLMIGAHLGPRVQSAELISTYWQFYRRRL